MSLKAGRAITDITPDKPMFLAGYPHVERISNGTHDPLYASALYLENGTNSLIMIAVDILFLDSKTIYETRKKIAKKTGVKAKNIMISCTHTHSGPLAIDMLAFRNDPVVPEVNLEYMRFLKMQIIEAGLKAVKSIKLAEIAVTSVDITGVGRNRHSYDGSRDPEAGILLIRDYSTKAVEAVSLIYCMHPTVLHEDSKLFSSDFPGYTREYLKSCFGKDITILYHTGPEGNLSPRYDVDGQTFDEAKRLGNILGKYIADKINLLSDKDFDADPYIDIASKVISPVRRKLPSFKEAEKNLIFRKLEFERLKSENAEHGPVRTAECSVFGAEETLFLTKCASNGTLDAILTDYTEVEVQVMRIGDTYIAAFPGEMFVEYSLGLKMESSKKTFAICLANGEMQGYIVTENASGYEADNSLFTPETGNIMVKAALKLISDLMKNG
jgi:hypothetical protein